MPAAVAVGGSITLQYPLTVLSRPCQHFMEWQECKKHHLTKILAMFIKEMNVIWSRKAWDPSKAHISSGKAVFHQREGTFLWCLWFKFEPDAISDVTSNPRWNWVGRSRSSLVFKQPTISILSTPNIERWMVETRYKWMLIFMENNVTPL